MALPEPPVAACLSAAEFRTPTASCDQSVVSSLISSLKPELSPHAIRHHRPEAVRNVRHSLADARPQFGGIADRVRGRSCEERTRLLDLLLQFLVIGAVP